MKSVFAFTNTTTELLFMATLKLFLNTRFIYFN